MATHSDKLAAPRLKLQVLEGREVPASLVTGVVANGVLTLTGDDAGNVFTLKDTGTGMTVTGNPDTQVKMGANVSGAQTFAGVTAVKLVLKGGNDTVALDAAAALNLAGAFTADMGAGDNTLDLSGGLNTAVVGSLSYTGLAGKDTALFGREFGGGPASAGQITFNGGAGDNRLTVAKAAVLGVGYTGLAGGDALALTDTTVLNNVQMNGGASEAGVTENVLTLDGTTVTGNVALTGAGGINRVKVVGSPVVIKGATGLTVGGANSHDSVHATAPLTVQNGGISAIGANRGSAVVLEAGAFVKKDVIVSNAGAYFAATMLTAQNVTVTGVENAELSVDGTGIFSGNVAVTATAADALATFKGVGAAVNGALKVASTNGKASAKFYANAVAVKGLTTVSGGATADMDDWTTGGATFGAVTLASAKGTAEFAKFGGGTLTVGGTLTAAGAKDAGLYLSGPQAKTLKDVSVAGAAGTGYVLIVGGQTTIDGSIAVSGFSTDVKLDGDATTSWITKNVTVTGQAGADDFAQRNGFDISGNVTLNLGDGEAKAYFGSGATAEANNVSVTTGAGDDEIQFFNYHVNGTTTIKTGGGADGVFLDKSEFYGAFALDAGAGNDVLAVALFNTNAPVTFHGTATIKLGAGDDTLAMGTPGNDLDKAVFLTAGSTIDGGLDTDGYNFVLGQGADTPNLTWTNFEVCI